MKNRTFFFSQNEKTKWQSQINEISGYLTTLARGIILGEIKIKDNFEIEIKKTSKRSGQQLNSYWRWVKTIKDYRNSQGNFFCDEEIHQWIKISAGHYKIIDGEKVAKSISSDSNTTKEDMKNIFDFIKHFAIKHGLKNYDISEREMNKIL